MSLDEFVFALTKIDIKALDSHFSPQIFAVRPSVINYDFLLRFENLNEEIEKMNKSLNLNVSLNKKLKVTGSNKVRLSSNHLDFINKFYAKDFNAFGYNTRPI